MMDYQKNEGYEIDWDSAIENDSTFSLIPEGDYTFTVVKFERARHEGSAKLPSCHKAVLGLNVVGTDGAHGYITHNLFLHSSTEGLICAFFTAIGQRKHGEKLVPRWHELVGSTGACQVGLRTYTKRDGSTAQSNEIKRFYDKPLSQATPVSTPSYTQGAF